MQRDEEETAKLYEEFQSEFAGDGEGSRAPKAFVRGGTILPGKSAAHASSSRSGKGGKAYVPSFIPPGMQAALLDKEKPQQKDEEVGGSACASCCSQAPAPAAWGRAERAAPSLRCVQSVFSRPAPSSRSGKPRAIDQLLSKIQR